MYQDDNSVLFKFTATAEAEVIKAHIIPEDSD